MQKTTLCNSLDNNSETGNFSAESKSNLWFDQYARVGKMRILIRINIRILHVVTSADPHYTPGLTIIITLSLLQLILAIHDLAKSLDSGSQVDAMLLDFSKAFDKVPHQRLLYKLQYYGIHGNTLNWISAFLSNRTQSVACNSYTSSG